MKGRPPTGGQDVMAGQHTGRPSCLFWGCCVTRYRKLHRVRGPPLVPRRQANTPRKEMPHDRPITSTFATDKQSANCNYNSRKCRKSCNQVVSQRSREKSRLLFCNTVCSCSCSGSAPQRRQIVLHFPSGTRAGTSLNCAQAAHHFVIQARSPPRPLSDFASKLYPLRRR